MIRLAAQAIGEWARIRRVFSSAGLGGYLTRQWPILGARAARAVARAIKRAALSAEMRPNSMATIIMKMSNIPLIETNQLVRSIKDIKLPDGSYYGGVDPTGVHTKSNIPLWVIAIRQNSGYVIPVTNALREKFRAAGLKLGNDTKALVVPPRQFLDIGIEKGLKEVEEKVIKTIPRDINEVIARA